MRRPILLFFLFTLLSCSSQHNQSAVNLSVSPAIKQTKYNITIIKTLKLFLESKNTEIDCNRYWDKKDCEKYIHPFSGILNIESGKLGPNYYQPTLMEIIDTENPAKKIIKVAYIGHNEDTKENTVRCIYNIIASLNEDSVIFSSYLDYATSKWERRIQGNINYCVSPSRSFSKSEADRQQKDIEKLCHFFNTGPLPITYFSCMNPVELFNIKGFDYNPMMYVSATGGFAEEGNIIFSGNNSDYYTHEIVHIYTHELYPDIPKFIDEGLATYFGGSGKFDYQWHKKELKSYLLNNKIDYERLIENPFERLYINDETPIPYLVGAVICEKAIKEIGKDKFLELLKDHPAEAGVWDLLKKMSVTKENIKAVMAEFMQKP